MKTPVQLLAIACTVLLAACGGGLSGTYEGGFGSLTFASGKVDARLMGNTIEMPYTTDGDKIVLKTPPSPWWRWPTAWRALPGPFSPQVGHSNPSGPTARSPRPGLISISPDPADNACGTSDGWEQAARPACPGA